ncbi:MAG: flippase-like domain-containing protein [Opitutae bacterium]|nr:flippase-like domain-containing protein [Opitutae bacterium]
MSANFRKAARLLLKVAISCGLLGWVLSKLPWSELVCQVMGLDIRWILAALCLLGFSTGLSTIRWQFLLAVQGIRLPLAGLFRLQMIGQFFNSFLLGSTGGDVVLIYYAAGHAPTNRTGVAVSVLADRLLGLAGLTWWVVAVVPFLPCRADTTVNLAATGAWLAGAAVLGLGAIACLLFTPAGRRWSHRFPDHMREGMHRVHEALGLHRGQPALLGASLLLAIAIPLAIVGVGWCLARAQGLAMPYPTLLGVLPLVLLVSSVPVSIGGLGTREGVVALLFPAYGLVEPAATATAVAFSLLWYLLNILWGAIGGIVYVNTRRAALASGLAPDQKG